MGIARRPVTVAVPPRSPAREVARAVLAEVIERLAGGDHDEWPGTRPGVIYLEVVLPPGCTADLDLSTAAGRVQIRIAG